MRKTFVVLLMLEIVLVLMIVFSNQVPRVYPFTPENIKEAQLLARHIEGRTCLIEPSGIDLGDDIGQINVNCDNIEYSFIITQSHIYEWNWFLDSKVRFEYSDKLQMKKPYLESGVAMDQTLNPAYYLIPVPVAVANW